jgi:hypothetical protein
MLVEKNNILAGTFSIDGDLTVEGSLSGEANVAGALSVGKDGKVEGNVQCRSALIEGIFTGTLRSEARVSITAAALLRGSIRAPEVVFQPMPEAHAQAGAAGGPGSLEPPQEREKRIAAGIPLVTGASGKILVKPTSVLKRRQ